MLVLLHVYVHYIACSCFVFCFKFRLEMACFFIQSYQSVLFNHYTNFLLIFHLLFL
jgi:hypothetical protein